LNGKKIQRLKSQHIRIRPPALRFDDLNNQLPQIDNDWFVLEAGRHGVSIRNSGYDHTLNLNSDQIREFRTDPSGRSFGLLMLNGQVWVRGNEAGVEPFPPKDSVHFNGPAPTSCSHCTNSPFGFALLATAIVLLAAILI